MAVRFIKQENVDASGFALYVEGFCDSDDTKPTGAFATGSKLTEVDTGDVYYYSEDDSDWVNPSATPDDDT